VWCHDASAGTMPEEVGTAWCREWLQNEAIPALQNQAA
jgi:MioC protein